MEKCERQIVGGTKKSKSLPKTLTCRASPSDTRRSGINRQRIQRVELSGKEGREGKGEKNPKEEILLERKLAIAGDQYVRNLS